MKKVSLMAAIVLSSACLLSCQSKEERAQAEKEEMRVKDVQIQYIDPDTDYRDEDGSMETSKESSKYISLSKGENE